jgi:hypothetical protein
MCCDEDNKTAHGIHWKKWLNPRARGRATRGKIQVHCYLAQRHPMLLGLTTRFPHIDRFPLQCLPVRCFPAPSLVYPQYIAQPGTGPPLGLTSLTHLKDSCVISPTVSATNLISLGLYRVALPPPSRPSDLLRPLLMVKDGQCASDGNAFPCDLSRCRPPPTWVTPATSAPCWHPSLVTACALPHCTTAQWSWL